MQAHATTLKLAQETVAAVDQQIAVIKQHETARNMAERAALEHEHALKMLEERQGAAEKSLKEVADQAEVLQTALLEESRHLMNR